MRSMSMRTRKSPRANLTIGGILLALGLWDLFFVLFRTEGVLFTVGATLLLMAGSFNIWLGFTQLRRGDA